MTPFPSFDLTNFDLVPATRTVRAAGNAVAGTAASVAREATFTAVGLGILAYQRFQVQRREFERATRDA